MALKGKSITILGAGIGGLTAAIALSQRGARVVVLDQAPELGEVGAGIQITPNGTAVFEALGLGPIARRVGTGIKAVVLCDYRRGSPVLRLDMTRAKHGNNNPYLAFHRADLIEMLADAATRHGVELRFAQKVTEVAIGPDRVNLPVAGGAPVAAEILIGADGIRSLTRSAMNPAETLKFTGQIAWRAILEASLLPSAPLPPVATVYMGRKRHLVTYPLRGGKLINVVAVKERSNWADEGWTHLDDPENLRAAFADFSPEIRRMLSLCKDVHLWGLFAHPVAGRWYQGGAVILGDAAHPTLPFLAQGANMAIEDGWVLAAELDRHDTLQAGFSAYQKRRQGRCRRIVEAATNNTRIYHLSPPPLRAVAHQAMRFAGLVAPAQILARYDWLYGCDVTKGPGPST